MARYIDEVGSFRCQVVEPQAGWIGETEEKKTPFIRIPCVVNDPESSQHGREIVHTMWLSDGAVDRTVKDLAEIFGWDGNLEALAAGEGFTGQECVIVTESEEYNGKTRIKSKWINSIDRAPTAMAKEKVASLISKLNSRTKAIAKSAAASAPDKPQPKPETKSKSPF